MKKYFLVILFQKHMTKYLIFNKNVKITENTVTVL